MFVHSQLGCVRYFRPYCKSIYRRQVNPGWALGYTIRVDCLRVL